MTVDDAKAFLNQAYCAKKRIAALKSRLDYWQRLAESTTLELRPDAAFSSLPGKKVETCACNIVTLKNELLDEIADLCLRERTVAKAISDAVKDPTLRVVLELRYLNGLTFCEIATRMSFSSRWVQELYNRALAEFAKNSF